MIKKLALTCVCVAAVLLLTQFVSAKVLDDIPERPDEIKVRRLEMVFSTATVRVNQERTLYVEVVPYNADDQTIYWTTGNPEIVTVDDEGVITGISPGTAEITATSNNGRTAVCVVTVPGKVLTEIELQTSNKENPLAGVDGGEVLSAAKLRLDAENAAKSVSKGQTATVTYTDKTQVSTAALRSAAFTAEYQGRGVSVRFRTLDGAGNTQGQLTLDPKQAGKEDMDIRVGVYTDAAKTADAQARATAHFGSGTAVVQLSQDGSYGMTARVAAKADLSGMDPQKLELYRYAGGTYTPLENPAYRIDENGYLHFSTDHGGVIVVVSG